MEFMQVQRAKWDTVEDKKLTSKEKDTGTSFASNFQNVYRNLKTNYAMESIWTGYCHIG